MTLTIHGFTLAMMACEIYNALNDFSLLHVNREPSCRYEPDCSKTNERCVFGRLIIQEDIKSRKRAITPEDIEQDRILAELEAQAK